MFIISIPTIFPGLSFVFFFFFSFLFSSNFCPYSDIFFLIGVITVFCISFPTTFPAFPLSPKNCPAAPFKSPFTILFPISFSSFFPFLICSAVMSDVISLSGSNWAYSKELGSILSFLPFSLFSISP